MRLFKWTKLHAAFVPEIDAEHRNLFRLGDELQEALQTGAVPERVRPIVQSLVAGFEDHFSHEERLMRASRYTIYTWHKQQHDGARRKIRQFEEAIAQGDAAAPQQMAEYLSNWVKGHVGLADRMFGAHMRNYERLQSVAS